MRTRMFFETVPVKINEDTFIYFFHNQRIMEVLCLKILFNTEGFINE